MAQNELQIVTFEQAKRLKAAGFDWEVNKIYDIHHSFRYDKAKLLFDYPTGYNNNSDRNDYSDVFSAPTVALALKWFRDVKGATTTIAFCNEELLDDDEDDGAYYGYRGKREKRFSCVQVSIGDSYEEAESALLDALLTELEASETACE